MERVNKLFEQIQSTVPELLSSPDKRDKLQSLQASLRANWEEYRKVVAELRPTLTDEDEIKDLNHDVARATRTFNLSDQGISNKLAKLVEDEQKRDIKPAITATTSTQSEQTEKTEEPLEQTKASEPAKPEQEETPLEAQDTPEARVLAALLKLITAQYNEILSGNYPGPTTKRGKVGDATDPDYVPDATDGPEDTDATVPAPPNNEMTTSHHHQKDAAREEKSTGTQDAEQAKAPKRPKATKTPSKPEPAAAPASKAAVAAAALPAAAQPSGSGIQQPTIELKMDKITLPTFDGDLTNWLPFKDQFVDLVHTNPRYTAITKFIQLRNHLKGMALEAINGFKLSASNYDAAWYVLTRRYDKTVS